MFAEILKHKDDKMSLEDMRPENVYTMCVINVRKRMGDIDTTDVEFIRKQCVHMANYLYFMWTKMDETDKLNR